MEPQPVQQEGNVVESKEEIAINTITDNGSQVDQLPCNIKQEEACAQTTGLDPRTGLLYTMTGTTNIALVLYIVLKTRITEGQTLRSEVEQPPVDIFSTAIASADIDMDSSAFVNDGDYLSFFL